MWFLARYSAKRKPKCNCVSGYRHCPHPGAGVFIEPGVEILQVRLFFFFLDYPYLILTLLELNKCSRDRKYFCLNRVTNEPLIYSEFQTYSVKLSRKVFAWFGQACLFYLARHLDLRKFGVSVDPSKAFLLLGFEIPINKNFYSNLGYRIWKWSFIKYSTRSFFIINTLNKKEKTRLLIFVLLFLVTFLHLHFRPQYITSNIKSDKICFYKITFVKRLRNNNIIQQSVTQICIMSQC